VIEAKIGHAGARFRDRRALCSERPMTRVASASPSVATSLVGVPPSVSGVVCIDQMAVERIAEVGQHHRQQAEGLDPAP
jgi:hypothetical protein